MLVSVSPELAEFALNNPVIISKSGFRIFVVWLLYRELDNIESTDATWITQVSLAEAWGLGADYHIPAFQNAVMRMLKNEFLDQAVDTDALKEAYRTAERNTKLQQACVAQIVEDTGSDPAFVWDKEDFTTTGLEKIPGFCLDMAVRFGAEKLPGHTSTDIENFLVDEGGEDCEDDESVTEG
jgi:hypothetical protein